MDLATVQKGAPMSFLDKAKDLLSQNAEKVEQAIDKAGDIIDEKTQGKFSSTVDKVQGAAKNAVGNKEQNTDQNAGQHPDQQN